MLFTFSEHEAQRHTSPLRWQQGFFHMLRMHGSRSYIPDALMFSEYEAQRRTSPLRWQHSFFCAQNAQLEIIHPHGCALDAFSFQNTKHQDIHPHCVAARFFSCAENAQLEIIQSHGCFLDAFMFSEHAAIPTAVASKFFHMLRVHSSRSYIPTARDHTSPRLFL